MFVALSEDSRVLLLLVSVSVFFPDHYYFPISAHSLSCPGFKTVGTPVTRLFVYGFCMEYIHVKLVPDDEICVLVIEFLCRSRTGGALGAVASAAF